MTEREDALKALLKIVEDGTLPDELVLPSGLPQNCGYDAVCAYHGSLDAAKALHEVVLPGWRVSVSQEMDIIGPDDNFLAFVGPMDATKREHVFRPSGKHRCPARAWLIAILKALIAQEDA